jgi:hypothetical protein
MQKGIRPMRDGLTQPLRANGSEWRLQILTVLRPVLSSLACILIVAGLSC